MGPSKKTKETGAQERDKDNNASTSKNKYETTNNEKRLKDKVAIITVGAEGFGEAIASHFHGHGAKVIIASTEGDVGLKLAKELKGAVHITWDVTKKENEKMIKKATNGEGKLDIMVNNAEFVHDSTESSDEYDMKPFEHAMSKVKNVMHGFKHTASLMKPKGCIISTACIARTTGQITPLAYATSKHAVIGLTKNAAAKFEKDGIRVNCVSSNGVGKFTDIAEAVLYFASEEMKYVSGHNLVVDGGFKAANYKWGLYCLQ